MSGASFESVLTHLLRQVGGPERPEYLMLRGAPAPIVLVFEPGKDLPIFVFKGARDRSQVGKEYSILRLLHETAPKCFGKTIPRPIRISDGATGLTGALSSALPGTRLKDLPPGQVFGSANVDTTLAEVTRWLVDFHDVSGRLHGTHPPAGRRALIEQPVEKYLEWFRVSADERALVQESAEGLPDPGSAGLPHCLGHGDFSPANVLWDRGRIGVIDFEYALNPSLALEDLFHFLASMMSSTSARDRAQQRRARFEETFYGQGYLAQGSQRAVMALARRVAVNPDLIEKLFVMAWVRYAVTSLEHWARSLGHAELLNDPDRLWPLLDAEQDEFLPVSRLGQGICGNVRQHLEMRNRFVLG